MASLYNGIVPFICLLTVKWVNVEVLLYARGQLLNRVFIFISFN